MPAAHAGPSRGPLIQSLIHHSAELARAFSATCLIWSGNPAQE
jgi:hypothetical protein